MGTTIKGTVMVDMNLSNVTSGINKLKNQLKSLKLPADATSQLENNLDSLDDEIKNFDKLKSKPIKAGDNKGMRQLEQSYQRILNLSNKINSQMSSLGKGGKNQLIPTSELQKMDSLQQKMNTYMQSRKDNSKQIKDTQKNLKRAYEVQQLLQNKNVSKYAKATSSEKQKITRDTNKNGTAEDKQALERYKKLNKANQGMSASQKLNFGNITSEITRLENALKTLSGGSGLDKIRSELASLKGVSIDKIPKDIDKLNNEIKTLQVDKVDQLRNAIQRLGTTSGLDKMSKDLNRGKQELQQYRGEFDKLTMKQRDADDMKYRLTNFFSWSEGLNLLKRGAREAFQAVKELDDAMTGTAVVTDFTISDLWDLMPKYTETANKLGATVKGAYETMTLYYQQGLDTEAAFGMGEETMKMSRIADMDYTEGTNLMTAAIRGFNMDLTKQSATWVNDVYSELAAISASDTHEIATAMTKTASIANSANADFDNTAAFLTQMINFATYTRVA